MTVKESELVSMLFTQYGALLSAREVRALLKFNSPGAFCMARKRGHVQLESIRIPGRKQFMYAVEDVAKVLVKWKCAAPLAKAQQEHGIKPLPERKTLGPEGEVT